MESTTLPSYLENAIKLFSLITALTFILGYIGFYTFTAIYGIPVNSADLSVIVGIGLFNLTYLLLLYWVAPKKRFPDYTNLTGIFFITLLLMQSPISTAHAAMAYILLFGILIPAIQFQTPKKVKVTTFAEKQRKADLYYRNKYITVIIIAVAILVFSFFYDHLTSIVLMDMAILYLCHYIKRKKIGIQLYLVPVFLLFPVITMYYIVSDSSSNLIGLNKINAKVMTSRDTLNSVIIYTDNNFYYLKENKEKQILTINKNEIKKIITIPGDTNTHEEIADKIGNWWKKKFK